MRPRTILHEDGIVTRSTVRMTSACGKRLYSSRKDALGRAAVTARETGHPTTAVHCHDCHGFHLAPKVVEGSEP